MADSNPIKLCECGCGQPAPLATKTDKSTNRVAGQPMRFISGHNGRVDKTFFRHGMTDTPTWKSWAQMKARCTNPRDKGWPNYGGRGITVCDRWLHSFENFLADMGPKPIGLTLDRIDNSLGYFPGNCRWVTRYVQSNNRRNNIVIEHGGQRRTLSGWAEATKIDYTVLWNRLQRGDSPPALFRQVRRLTKVVATSS